MTSRSDLNFTPEKLEITISTIIPTFINNNHKARQLLRCLDSVAQQTLSPLEIIISDNSLNLSGLFIAEHFFKKNDSRINVVLIDARADMGIASNSNRGMAEATGKILHVLHQDDFMISRDTYELVSNYYLMNPQTSWLFLGRKHHKHLIPPTFSETLVTGINSLGGPSCLFSRKERYLSYKPRFEFLVDIDLYLRMIESNGVPTLIDDIFVEIELTGERVSNTISEDSKIIEIIELLKTNNHSTSWKNILQILFRTKQIDVSYRYLIASREGGLLPEQEYLVCLVVIKLIKVVRTIRRAIMN